MVRKTTRRSVLRGAAAGTAGTLFAGTALGARAPRRIVGVESNAGARAAERSAAAVDRTLDFGEIGGAIAGRFSDEAVERLQARRDVRYVEGDGRMHALGAPAVQAGSAEGGDGGVVGSAVEAAAETLGWGVDRVDAEVAHANGDTGAGADVAIIDSGIDSDHPDLQANLGSGRAFVDCKGSPNKVCLQPWDDDNDHGTHCAGIADAVDNAEGVVGVSTEATLHAVKVLDKRGSGSFSDVAAGIEYVADQGWDVASLSLGASSGSQTVKDACQYAVDNGVLVVAAAGNSGPCSDCVGYPAAYDTVVAVSSTTQTDGLSGFSSTGPEVEIAAPGSNIYSTIPDGYDTFSGTSMACPHVSGAGAQLMANGASHSQARSTLASSAEDIGLSSNESGSGLLDVAAALGHDSSDN